MSHNIPDVIPDVSETILTNYIGFASFTALIWDHIITFGDEVQYVWNGRKGLFVYLFLFNRYFTPLSFIINLFAYLSPWWTLERCDRFVRFEGVTVALAVEISGVMMYLRINALYPLNHPPPPSSLNPSSSRWTSWFSRFKLIPANYLTFNFLIRVVLVVILLIETGVNIFLIWGARPVPHNPLSGMHACTMIFDSSKPVLAASSAWIPLLYDTIVFLLTLYRTAPVIKSRKDEASYIVKKLLEDGIVYYGTIVSVTLALTIMIIAAPPGTKNIAAQTEQLITVAMMSRITLNLRKAGRIEDALVTPKTFLFDLKSKRRSRYSTAPSNINLPDLRPTWERSTFERSCPLEGSMILTSTMPAFAPPTPHEPGETPYLESGGPGARREYFAYMNDHDNEVQRNRELP